MPVPPPGPVRAISQLPPNQGSELSLLTFFPRKDLEELVVTGPELGHIVLLQGSLHHTGGLVLTRELGKESGRSDVTV